MRAVKQKMLSWIEGKVLEIGPGQGENFKFFNPKKVEWIGVEPVKGYNGEIRKQARKHGFKKIEIINAGAEKLPLKSKSVDYVVGTMVLCSVKDPETVLSEILRVLKNKGVYVFIEHIAAKEGSYLRKLQDIYRWNKQKIKEGCRPNQDTLRYLERCSFNEIAYKTYKVKNHLLSPRIAGFAFR